MALIHCGEYNSEISDKSQSCVRCGAPIARHNESQAARTPLATTLLTSKKFKLNRLLSIIILAVGASWTYIATEAQAPAGIPAIITTLGLFWLIITKIRTWCHHS